jgi:hypothetical protein
MTRIDRLRRTLGGPGADARTARLRRRFERVSARSRRVEVAPEGAWVRTALGLIACLTAFALMAMAASDRFG